MNEVSEELGGKWGRLWKQDLQKGLISLDRPGSGWEWGKEIGLGEEDLMGRRLGLVGGEV